MSVPHGLVIGTAGHIDHGKTTLIRALTGIDTDRLEEEKQRGISIDLGFAHLDLPDGRRIGFVDVPGHERFIKNMLAGAGGIDAVLLVVAANESVKPQTREHLAICRLLGVKYGLIALTKTDLVSAEELDRTRAEIASLCRGSFLQSVPVIPVSAATGEGISELKRALALLAGQIPARSTEGIARLPIDRSFALKGFGTIVTGTLWRGTLRTGDLVQLHPSGRQLRVRGLEVHNEPWQTACAGQRTAVNLAGIEAAEIRRGDVLTQACGFESTTLFDAMIEWLDEAQAPHARETFLLHTGTAEIPARLKVLAGGAARLWLSRPALVLPADRFVLRRPSPAQTVGGGFVVDPFPPRHLSRIKAAQRTEKLASAGPVRRVEILVEESPTGKRIPELLRATGWSESELERAVQQSARLLSVPSSQRVLTKQWLQERRQKLVEWLTLYHRQNPSAAGAPISAARLGLDAELANLVIAGFPEVRLEGNLIALRQHQVQLNSDELNLLERIEDAFRRSGMQPPAPADVLTQMGAPPGKARQLLEMLVKDRKLVRLREDLIFHSDVIARIRKSLSAQKGRKFSIPEFKQWTNVSRKYAIPLLEYLDHERVTRREGDFRVIL